MPTPGPTPGPTPSPTNIPTFWPTEPTDELACFDAEIVSGTTYTNVLDTNLQSIMDNDFSFEVIAQYEGKYLDVDQNRLFVEYCLIVDRDDVEVVDEKFNNDGDVDSIENRWETLVEQELGLAADSVEIEITYKNKKSDPGQDSFFGDVSILVGIAGGVFALCCLFMFVVWRKREVLVFEDSTMNTERRAELEMQSQAAKSIYVVDSNKRRESELPPGTEKKGRFRLASPQGNQQVLHLANSGSENEYLSYDPAGTMREEGVLKQREGEGQPLYETEDGAELGDTIYEDPGAVVRPATLRGNRTANQVGEADEEQLERKQNTGRDVEMLFLPGDERGRATSSPEEYGATASPSPIAPLSPPSGEPQSPEIRRPSGAELRRNRPPSEHQITMGQMKDLGFHGDGGGTAGGGSGQL